MLSLRQVVLATDAVNWWSIEGWVVVGNSLLASLASAAGVVWLPNRLAWRVSHALAAALVSIAFCFVLLSTAASLRN